MQETMDSVNQWVDDNFGPAASNFRVATRANEELAEALRAIAADPQSDKAAVEAADTIIVLCRLAKAAGLDWGEFAVETRVIPATFATTPQYFTYANRCMAQLLCDLALDDQHPDSAGMLARVYITLQMAIRRWNLEPQDVIAGKMVVNRGRIWKKTGDGTGYHVRQRPDWPPLTDGPVGKDGMTATRQGLDAISPSVSTQDTGKVSMAGLGVR